MNVARYEPWSLHRDLWQEVNKMFDRAATNDTSGATADWVPPVDIEEYADRFALYIDVPGVDPTSIEVTLEKGVLTIAGSRAEAEKPEGAERRRMERASGRFHRRFTLPDTADAEGVTANGRNGVLEIGIPKRAASQPRRIAVSA
ncbi:Hsp20/alpha crystallin family protein [Algiphilus sp. W345]|uniref:Hsp20/alpha crystallin family protein n=1 Tax=Banduia mediterranea TaxID=3075609 RepID=A0ABU2WIA3_9GAMM|nr:Hsp20/alpha crystallin family protein [Algiphilus sp. W345]MDT0497597.1 Hsp20/alpha crystallin family protein [Algiphilus sp. W345]